MKTIKKFIKTILWWFQINIFFYLIVPGSGINKGYREQKIVVSLTSIPDRLKSLHVVIKSIMRQTMKPDLIIIYLGEDVDEKTIPASLISLKKKGLMIKFVPENLMSHKKYYYAFREYPNDLIITIDDDLLYEPKMIELLYKAHTKYPNSVCAKRVHKPTKSTSGELLPYNEWHLEYTSELEPSTALFATSGAGTLFVPSLFDDEIYRKDRFMEICKTADDVWIKFMEIRCGIPVVFVPGDKIHPRVVPNTQNKALWKINKIAGSGYSENDRYIKQLEDEYRLKLSDYIT